MSIALYFSNQLKPLAAKLKINLEPGQADLNVLEPPLVIVPNMNLSKWLKLNLARQSSICMNVAFEFLETGLWQMTRRLDPKPAVELERMDTNGLTTLLFFILMQTDRHPPDLIPVQRYLKTTTDASQTDLEMRCWQLAGVLAHLFQEYEYHRWDMIQGWLDDRQPDDAMERCQKAIYRQMRLLKKQLGQLTDRPIYSMAEYALLTLSSASNHIQVDPACHPRVHFFGLSQISPLHIRLLSELKPYFDIHIYSLNPSREYWEDIQTPHEKRWIRRRQVNRLMLSEKEIRTGDLFETPDHALLAAWGRPGRESIRLLCQLTDYDFHAGYAQTPEPGSILSAIGYGLLTLDGNRFDKLAMVQDRSLQIVACPGIRREVETVYNSIMFNLEHDETLNLTDIAVMVSDMPRYKPVIDSVFNQQPSRISYNLVDSSARTESMFAQAVMALAELATGNFSRKLVFDLLRNPCVMQRWKYGHETLTVWIAWADALGIFNRYENPKAAADGIPVAGQYTWRQGLERLRLARIMMAPEGTADDAHHFNGLVPYADIRTGDDRLVEKFCRLVESLHTAIAALQITSAPARSWRRTLFQVVDKFIDITADMRGEDTVYQSLVRAFDAFTRYDDLADVQPARPLSASALWTFVRTHLEGITGGQGDYLTGGVTISALMPMRPIPFKVVYVLGLEEGRFPGRVSTSLLDLRHRKRRIGDISPTERNCYLFLEILLSVRCKLYLSYQHRDLQTDRDLAPCSVVHQLRRYVERQLLDGQAFKINQIPIRADSPAYIAPEALTDWSDTLVEPNPIQRLSCYRRSGLWEAFIKRASATDIATVAGFSPDFSLPVASSETAPIHPILLTTDILRQFLLNPLRTVARYHFGIVEHSDATAELAVVEDEPIASSFPTDYAIRTIPVNRWIAAHMAATGDNLSMAALEREFDRVYSHLARTSKVPAGAFAAHDRSRLKHQVLGVGQNVLPIIDQWLSARRRYAAAVVGEATDDAVDIDGDRLRFGPVMLPIESPATIAEQPVIIQLSGGVPWLWQAEDNGWHCLVVTGSNRRSRHPNKYVVGPLLTLLAATASGRPDSWFDDSCLTVHVILREHVLNLDYQLTRDRSIDYLNSLIGTFLNPMPLSWLPFEVIFDHTDLRTAVLQDHINDVDREMFGDRLSQLMRALTDPQAELIGARVGAQSLDQARQRFRIFAPTPSPRSVESAPQKGQAE